MYDIEERETKRLAPEWAVLVEKWTSYGPWRVFWRDRAPPAANQSPEMATARFGLRDGLGCVSN